MNCPRIRLPSGLFKPALQPYFDYDDSLNYDYVMRPKLLDVFSGSGGCSMGYFMAGFAPYGIDNNPKPLRHYPFHSLCMDALEAMDRLLAGEGLTFSNGETLYLRDFAAIHASPPCQEYSRTKSLHPQFEYPDLLDDVRTRLKLAAKPWIIENVVGAPLEHWIMLCGAMFGLWTYRHRRFETSFLMMQREHPKHMAKVLNRGYDANWAGFYCVTGGGNAPVAVMKKAIGIDWMTREEFTQAIPSVYLEYIGQFLMKAIQSEVRA